jgi:hypothetical protein
LLHKEDEFIILSEEEIRTVISNLAKKPKLENQENCKCLKQPLVWAEVCRAGPSLHREAISSFQAFCRGPAAAGPGLHKGEPGKMEEALLLAVYMEASTRIHLRSVTEVKVLLSSVVMRALTEYLLDSYTLLRE